MLLRYYGINVPVNTQKYVYFTIILVYEVKIAMFKRALWSVGLCM